MFKSPRLIIKPWEESQAADFLELSLDPGFTLFPITIYHQTSVESAREWIKKAIALNRSTGMGKYAVIEQESGKLIGLGGLTPWTYEGEDMIDITYRLRESVWGKGYGHELAQALVTYGFEKLNLPEITATITPDNVASMKVAEKLGFKVDRNIVLLNVPTVLYRLRK